jgi:hypothetical protein
MSILALAARPLKNIPNLLLFPLAEIALGIPVFLLMVALCLYAISIGEISEVDTNVESVPGGKVKVI